MQRNPLFPKSQSNVISDPTLAYQKLYRVVKANRSASNKTETVEFCHKLLSKLEESKQVYSEILNHGKQIVAAQSPNRNLR